MTKACLRADVSYFLCCTRATKEIGDVYTQARLKRVRDLIQSIIQDYNNDEQEKYINLYKLINFYYGRHHYLSRNNNQTWWPIRLHKIDLNIKLHKRIRMPNYPRVGGSLNMKQALYDPSEANTAFFILPIYRLRWGRG